MNANIVGDPTALEKALRRLETLTAALDGIADSNGREAAREMVALMLDLHGLALARVTGTVAGAANGAALTEQLIADPHVAAMLLLHGLHPHDARTRVTRAIERMQPQWNNRGFHVDLLGLSAGSARVRLYKNGSAEPADVLRVEVEGILVDAAPDIDDIVIEIDGAAAPPVMAPALLAG